MLKRLFTSNARIKLLNLFLKNPTEEYFIRELTRKLDEQINSIRRELNNLKKLGLLQTSSRNRKKYYRINPKFIFLRELTAIFNKASGNQQDIVNQISELGEIEFLVLSGVFTNTESQIDLLIVGNVDKDRLAVLLEQGSESTEPIKFTVLGSEDFLYRYKCNDRFITSTIRDPDNIIAINNFTNQIQLDF